MEHQRHVPTAQISVVGIFHDLSQLDQANSKIANIYRDTNSLLNDRDRDDMLQAMCSLNKVINRYADKLLNYDIDQVEKDLAEDVE